MIRGLVDFALDNRWLVVGLSIMLFGWGIVSFHNLPVEAYPDVANNYVQVITQWPGRAAEEVEQQVTTPIEIQMAGIPHMTHLRSTSLAGLSSVTMIFDDDSVNKDNRDQVFQRLGLVTLPAGLQPQMGTDWSPVGQIYWYTLRSTNPAYDSMELKSLQDWKLEKEFKSVPGVVDVSSFGGVTREYQVRVDPNKLVAYGLSIGQLEQQLANNNTNAGGSFIEEGQQQVNVREVGLYKNVKDIEDTVLKTQSGTPLRVKDIATVVQGPKIRLGQIGKTCRFGTTPPAESGASFSASDPCVTTPTNPATSRPSTMRTGNSSTTTTSSKASSLCKKATTPTPRLRASTRRSTNSIAVSFPPASRSSRSSIAASCFTTRPTRYCITSPKASFSS